MIKSVQRQPNKAKIAHFRQAIICWFKVHGRDLPWRKKSISKYQIIVVEVLLQRTRAETIASFFPSFIQTYPNWAALANASEYDLQQFFRQIGLWRRRRAVSLLAFAQAMGKRNGRFPPTRTEIENLPSVGQYIANAILLFCHGDCQPLLDAGMARVLERVFGPRKLAEIRDDPYLQRLAKSVVTCDDPIATNWAILDLASLVCKKQMPRCQACPLSDLCCYCIKLRAVEGVRM